VKKYLITSPEHYTQESSLFKKALEASFMRHSPDFALYRDKENTNYKELAKIFVKLCKDYKVKAFVHGDYLLASELGADGVHLTSTQFSEIQNAKEKNLEVGISSHTTEEVLEAQKLGASYVTYSPIFASPGKGEPKGIEDLKALLECCKIKVFALGGIVNEEQVQEIQNTKVYGFASIRYFY
jgi:thiamine-phosphate pyrophosphorylase